LKGSGGAVETDALLLRSHPYRDADRIVTLLTADLGKVSAVARSARSSRRRFGGTLEPFVHFRATLVRGRSELYSLRTAEPIRAFAHIVANLGCVDAAAAGLVFVRELSPSDHPEPGMFAAALRWLTWLDHRDDPSRATLLLFVTHLLATLGTAPRLTSCGRCGRPAPALKAARFDAALGALVCRECGGASHALSARARAFWLSAFEDWLAAAQAPPSAVDVAQVREALAAFITAHMNPALASRLYPST